MNFITEILKGRVGLSRLGQLLVNQADGDQAALPLVKTINIPSAQVLTLFSVPQTVIPAPGAGLAVIPLRWMLHKPAGTAYAGIAAGEDLQLRYGTTSVQPLGVVETTGFLDQATAQTRFGGMIGALGATPADFNVGGANLPLVCQLLLGDITTGNSALRLRIWYDLVQVPF